MSGSVEGIRQLSALSKLNRECLYRMLSRSGNPSLASLHAVLGAYGLRLVIRPVEAKPKRRKRTAA